MARKVKLGTGITQYERTLYDMTGKEPADIGRVKAEFINFNDALERNGGFFGLVTEHARATCKTILADHWENWRAAPFEEDTPEFFARDVLVMLDYIPSHIERGEMDLALRWAFIAGRTWERAVMKWRWEGDALRGVKTAKAASAGGAARAGRLRPDTENRLNAMAVYVAAGHSVARAADLTARQGLGRFEGNKKLWARHRK